MSYPILFLSFLLTFNLLGLPFSGPDRFSVPRTGDIISLTEGSLTVEEFLKSSQAVASSISEQEELEYVRNDTGPLGNAGRWFIPSLDISVPVWAIGQIDPTVAQAYTDADNSAVWCEYYDGVYYVADHWTQNNFINIKDCTPGTKGYLKTGERIVIYTCVEATTGTNDGTYLYNASGQRAERAGHPLFAYTCNGNWQNIWLIYFDRMEEVPLAG